MLAPLNAEPIQLGRFALVRMLLRLTPKNRPPDDLQIQPETPVFYVIDVILYPFFL